MTPLQVAAKFAAFVWYTHSREASDQTIQREARQFAKENWQVFLPVAHEGLGQLLIRVSKRRQLHELPRRNSATQNACWLRPVECTIRRQSTVRHSSLAHFPAKRATKARFRRFSQPLQVRRLPVSRVRRAGPKRCATVCLRQQGFRLLYTKVEKEPWQRSGYCRSSSAIQLIRLRPRTRGILRSSVGNKVNWVQVLSRPRGGASK